MSIHLIKNINNNILFNALNNSTLTIDKEFDDLEKIILDKNISKELLSSENLTLNTSRMKSITESKISLTLMMSRTCNLKCTYCFAGEGEYGSDSNKPIFLESYKLMKVLEDLITLSPRGIKSVNFFGGEPLYNIDLFEENIETILKFCKLREIEIPRLSISTNATLLTEKMIEKYKKYNLSYALSLDGHKYLNDLSRMDNNNNSVYCKIEKSIILLKKHNIDFALQITINQKHLLYQNEFIHWLFYSDLLKNVKFIINPVTTSLKELTLESENTLKQLEKFIIKIVRSYYSLLQNKKDRFFLNFENTIKSFYLEEVKPDCNAGKSIFVDTNGEYYPCQLFCNNNDYLLGFSKQFNIKNMEIISNVSRFNSKECKTCISINSCHVWCKGINLLHNKDMFQPVKSRCIVQQNFTKEAIKLIVVNSETEQQFDKFIENFY